MTTKNTISLYMKDSSVGEELEDFLSSKFDNDDSQYMASGLLEYIGIESGEDFRPEFTFNEDGSATITMGKFTLSLSTEEVSGAAQYSKDAYDRRHQAFLKWEAERHAANKAKVTKKK
jgi:hypothetical protein